VLFVPDQFGKVGTCCETVRFLSNLGKLMSYLDVVILLGD